jgi:hypothetical protein
MSRVFICYRREDTVGYARHLFEKLEDRFGQGNVFMDIDSLPPGADFVQVIESSVNSCDVFLAIIGKQWLTVRDEEGRARLHSPEDFVRVEASAALARQIRLIPVLVGGARMPRSVDLPQELGALTRRNAFTLHDEGFRSRLGALIKEVDEAAKQAQVEREQQGVIERARQERIEREKAEAARKLEQDRIKREQARWRAEAEQQARDKQAAEQRERFKARAGRSRP